MCANSQPLHLCTNVGPTVCAQHSNSHLVLPVATVCCCAAFVNPAVVCPNAPPEMDDNTWPADCKDNALGFACKGVCDLGFTGSPTAVCKKGGWSANGGCKPAKCDGQPPAVANATWASCDDSPVGYVCSATCASPYEQSGPIQSTCTAGTKSASWSTPTEYCGIVRTQVRLCACVRHYRPCVDADGGSWALQQGHRLRLSSC